MTIWRSSPHVTDETMLGVVADRSRKIGAPADVELAGQRGPCARGGWARHVAIDGTRPSRCPPPADGKRALRAYRSVQ